MAAINAADWGRDIYDTTDPGNLAAFMFPATPACMYFQDPETASAYMRYGFRVHYSLDRTLDPTAIVQLRGTLDSEDTLVTFDLVDGDPLWSESDEYDPLRSPPPISPDSIEGYTINEVIGYERGNINMSTVSSDPGELLTGTIHGYEVSAIHDANPFSGGAYVELFDYEDNASWGEDCAAASFIITKLIAAAYNRIMYAATWRIGIAMMGYRAP